MRPDRTPSGCTPCDQSSFGPLPRGAREFTARAAPTCLSSSLYYLLLAVLLLFTSACRDTPKDRVADHSKPVADIEGDYRAKLKQLSQSHLMKIWQVGALRAPAEEVFGEITAIAVDEQGRLFALDSHYNEVRVFDANGNFISEAGGPGRGPGELSAPESLVLGRDDRLYVSDRRLLRISVFRFTDSALTYVDSFRLELVPESMCLLDNRLYIQSGWAHGSAGIIHSVSLAGRSLESFGKPHESENLIIQETLSSGRIGCFEKAEAVIMLPKYTPRIRAWSPDGRLLWVDTLPNYRQVTGTTIEQGGASFE